MKRVLSALLVLMLVLALLPASALAETPYTRADAAVYLAETFGLADIHASRIEGYETTPKEMGYSASSDAITAANVIAAAKDCVDLPTAPKIEAVINAQLLSLAEVISASARMRPSPCVKWPRPLPRRSTVPI